MELKQAHALNGYSTHMCRSSRTEAITSFKWVFYFQVFKKFGVEKFEPTGQQFDPNSHLALFEVPDPTKEAGTIAVVVKVDLFLCIM